MDFKLKGYWIVGFLLIGTLIGSLALCYSITSSEPSAYAPLSSLERIAVDNVTIETATNASLKVPIRNIGELRSNITHVVIKDEDGATIEIIEMIKQTTIIPIGENLTIAVKPTAPLAHEKSYTITLITSAGGSFVSPPFVFP